MKILVTILAILMMLQSGAVAEGSESLNYSDKTIDELMVIYESVRDEILSRIGVSDDSKIGRGTFVTGKTILPGTYEFICEESGVFTETGYVNNLITVDDSEGNEIFRAKKISVGGIVTFTLSDGDTLEIAGCSGTISLIVDPIWVP